MSSVTNNKNTSGGGAVGTKCHITITNESPPSSSTSSSSPDTSRPVLMIDPACQEIVSGHVTMVTVEGGAVAGQIERLQGEVTRLKVEKLELLRQNVAAQREVKHLRG